jgi:hypothetical protein
MMMMMMLIIIEDNITQPIGIAHSIIVVLVATSFHSYLPSLNKLQHSLFSVVKF